MSTTYWSADTVHRIHKSRCYQLATTTAAVTVSTKDSVSTATAAK